MILATAPESVSEATSDPILYVRDSTRVYPVRIKLPDTLVCSGAWKYPSQFPLAVITRLFGRETVLDPVRLVIMRAPDQLSTIPEDVAPENTTLPVLVVVPVKVAIFFAIFRLY